MKGKCTAAVLWSNASRICLKQHEAFFFSSYQAFSSYDSLESMLYIHLVVLEQPKQRRNFILFYQKDQIFIWLQSLKNQQQSPNQTYFDAKVLST